MDHPSPAPAPTPSTPERAGETVPYSLGELLRYFLKLGTFGFGGPIALVGYMQRDLVEGRRWISTTDYKEGLTLAQLAPGPLAAQLAIYLGWVRAGVWGASLVSLAFVLPSFLMVMVLSIGYVAYGGLSWMQGAFYGIGAAVIAIIGRSAHKLVTGMVSRDKLLLLVVTLNAITTAVTESEVVWVFFLCGLVVMLAKAPPRRGSAALVLAPWPAWLVTGAGAPASASTLGTLLGFFTFAGAVVFGSGLAIVPFLYGGVVVEHQWLTERQFLDAVAVAMITPGPVVITVAFIGYLVAGTVGAVLAAVGVFLPCYLFVVVLAPSFRKYSRDPSVKAFVDGVTAAATGAIAGAGVVLAKRAIVDVPTALIGLATLAALVYVKKVPEPLVILAAGGVGLLITGLGGR